MSSLSSPHHNRNKIRGKVLRRMHIVPKLRRATTDDKSDINSKEDKPVPKLYISTHTGVWKEEDADIFHVMYIFTITDKNNTEDFGNTYQCCIIIDANKETIELYSIHCVMTISANDAEKVDKNILRIARDTYITNIIARNNEYKLSKYNDLPIHEMLEKITGVKVPDMDEFVIPKTPSVNTLMDEYLDSQDLDEQLRGFIKISVHPDGAFIDHLLLPKYKVNPSAQSKFKDGQNK